MSTNRTAIRACGVVLAAMAPAWAQEASKPATPPAQSDAIGKIVASMQAAEKNLQSARIQLATTGRFEEGIEFKTRGVLHVLRGAQPAMHTLVEISFGDGITAVMESAQTVVDGITIYEDHPAIGEIHLHIKPSIVADLEWAGTVLDEGKLPGMADRRATAPLGSAMVVDLRRHFDLQPDARTERSGEAGQWLAGKRRSGLEDADPELQLADRVELFVRQRDQALVEVKHLQGDKVVQHIVVEKLECGLEIPAARFAVDGRGQKQREVELYPPMWDQIEKVLLQAEAQLAEEELRLADGRVLVGKVVEKGDTLEVTTRDGVVSVQKGQVTARKTLEGIVRPSQRK